MKNTTFNASISSLHKKKMDFRRLFMKKKLKQVHGIVSIFHFMIRKIDSEGEINTPYGSEKILL